MPRDRRSTETRTPASKKSGQSQRGRSKTREQPRTRLKTQQGHHGGHAVERATAKAMMGFIDRTVDAGIEGLRREFDKLGPPRNLASTAFKSNTLKNRYGNVSCFDATRVVLNYQAPPESDYIHANRVTTESATLTSNFICTQGPMDKTVNDFWRLVWQERPKFIVMLCRLYENGKPKCALYWPEKEGDSKTYGTITVTNDGDGGKDGEQVFDIEKFSVRAADSTKIHSVKHIRWLDWPDFGIPRSGLGMLRVLRKIEVEKGSTAIVHCSAGIGRTGTILAAEIFMKILQSGKHVKPTEVVLNLREQRFGMIQSASQYIYLHFSICTYCERKLEAQPDAADHLKRLKAFIDDYKEFANTEEQADRRLAAQGKDLRNATKR